MTSMDRERIADALRFYIERVTWIRSAHPDGDPEKREYQRLLAEFTDDSGPPSLGELMQFIARAWPPGAVFSSLSPISFTTSDGADVLVTVRRQPDGFQ